MRNFLKFSLIVIFVMALISAPILSNDLFGERALGQTDDAVAEGLILYTPFTSLSVTPGESVQFSIDIINRTPNIKNVEFSIKNFPEKWNYTITSEGNNIQKLAVKSQSFEKNQHSIELEVKVPLKVDKGKYNFKLAAVPGKGESYLLPLTVNVTEKGVFKTEFTSDQKNMEGYSDSEFTYEVTLRNHTPEKQHYALTANAPRGWDARFKLLTDFVTSVTLDSNETKTIDVKLDPSNNVKAGKYTTTVEAASGSTSKKLDLETVIKGRYDLNLTTPSGLLSKEITAGDRGELQLKVENKGSVALRNLSLSSTTPKNWSVTFNQKNIEELKAGNSRTLTATVTPGENTVAGDYQVNIKASTPEASSEAKFRITVKTSLLWGWVGIAIIAAVLLGVYYFVRKYGRR